MTEKEIKKLRKENPRFNNGFSCELIKEQKQLHRELDCREMINSCLCYNTDFLNSRYKDDYIKDLGKQRVIELYNEQKEDFDKAIVIRSVYQDDEGNSYNSIQWEDELEIN
ncbi:MAG: hypothetical protein IJJ82_07165 [Clostridia bacterium]|nr:hypothetical protein [Clostridia bacterium]